METTVYLAFAASACIIALGIMPVIIQLAEKRGIFEANDERKTHTEQVSSFGGVGIMAAFIVPILLLMQSGTNSPITAFALAIPLFAISLLDDIFQVKVAFRFAVHAAIGLLLYQLGFSIVDLGHPILTASATVAFTILLINAYNLIDGINGLSGGLGVIASLVFGLVLAQRGEQDLALACFSLTGALLGYLNYNFGKKALIFMGDNGSTILGFLTALMAMAIMDGEENSISGGSNLSLVFAVVSIPVVDVFKVAFIRVLNGKSPFQPDRSHVHHLYTDKLLSHPTACLLLFGWTMVQVTLAIKLPSSYSLQVVMALSVVPYLLAKALRSTDELIAGQPKRERKSILGWK
ncbi:MAG: undecaprenyl/decaprenyl-phosphate alpha-N-acetylglucosaminyl 1-phosphate transferase [Saprospiraceae bacterium]|nr:undecaprenyl/decaprenyl-phosphate alpha-N-acetylglucosaminyl 1-phosphate transferase [Saprospiraceae bacterium]